MGCPNERVMEILNAVSHIYVLPFSLMKSTKYINGGIHGEGMEDPFDAIPFPYRTERLCRMRDLIMQIEADYKRYDDLKQKVRAGIGNEPDREELNRTAAWLKRDITVYRRLNAMSIEGITCLGVHGFL